MFERLRRGARAWAAVGPRSARDRARAGPEWAGTCGSKAATAAGGRDLELGGEGAEPDGDDEPNPNASPRYYRVTEVPAHDSDSARFSWASAGLLRIRGDGSA